MLKFETLYQTCYLTHLIFNGIGVLHLRWCLFSKRGLVMSVICWLYLNTANAEMTADGFFYDFNETCFKTTHAITWATSQKTCLNTVICEQRRLKSVCPITQSDLSFCFWLYTLCMTQTLWVHTAKTDQTAPLYKLIYLRTWLEEHFLTTRQTSPLDSH